MDFICFMFEYYSLFNIVNYQMCEKLMPRRTYVIILLIELICYYVAYVHLPGLLLITCDDQYKLMKWRLQYAIILKHWKYVWSIIAKCVEIYV